jgi:Flp pilus assembly pilin Flp
MRVIHWLQRFVGDDSGQDLVEYALLIALIVLVAIAAVDMTGDRVQLLFQKAADALADAASAA